MPHTRKGKRLLAARVFDATGVRRVVSAMHAWSGLLVLNYHRIGHTAGQWADRGVFSATPEEFEGQIKFLSQEFEIIRLSEIEDILTHRMDRGVLITFDDGYRDNYDFAFPVLKNFGKSAVFFLTSGFLDHEQVAWWDELAWMVRSSTLTGIPANQWTVDPVPFDEPDREQAVRRLLHVHKQIPWVDVVSFRKEMGELLQTGLCPHSMADDLWMTWDMVREMRQAGMEFGGHTVTHPVLANLSLKEQHQEIANSKSRIERELNEPIVAFSYPVGSQHSFTEETQKLLKVGGYSYGFSFMRGLAQKSNENRLALPRFAVERNIAPSLFRAMVTWPQFFGM